MKKVLLSVLLFFCLFILLPKISFAQQNKALYPLNTNPDIPQNFHTYTQNVFIEVLSAATCFIGGTDILNPQEKCLGIDPATKKIGYVNSSGGLIGIMGGMIGYTYNIPISTSQYGHYLASNFGITKRSFAQNLNCEPLKSNPTAYRDCLEEAAQARSQLSSGPGLGEGIGFKGLTPVQSIWKTFRNLTYLLFVFIFVLLGLGIMFRINVDARAVMTLQNQIPKIIFGLILITFSYAIAGFLIDMMYVGIYLVIHLFQSQGLTTVTNIDTNPVVSMGSFGGINGIASPAAKGVGGIVSSLFSGSIGTIIGGIVMGIIGNFIGAGTGIPGMGIVGALVGGAIGLAGGTKLLGLIAMAIAYLIIAVAIFTSLFRVWFMLIKAYVFIFLDVIFAPFWIVGGLLPGAPGGFGPWFRSLLANLAGFPTVIVLFMIGKTIQDQAFNSGQSFIPPLVGNPGNNAGESIASIIGLGIILIMPEAVNITKSTLKAPDVKYMSAVGKAIGQGQGYVGKPLGSVWKELTGEKRDGSKGILRSTFETKASQIGRQASQRTGISKVWGKTNFKKWVDQGRERQKLERQRHLGINTDNPTPSSETQQPTPNRRFISRINPFKKAPTPPPPQPPQPDPGPSQENQNNEEPTQS